MLGQMVGGTNGDACVNLPVSLVVRRYGDMEWRYTPPQKRKTFLGQDVSRRLINQCCVESVGDGDRALGDIYRHKPWPLAQTSRGWL